MKEMAKLKQLPPVYTGRWASATEQEVLEELTKGTPYTYRFRVPKEGSLKLMTSFVVKSVGTSTLLETL